MKLDEQNFRGVIDGYIPSSFKYASLLQTRTSATMIHRYGTGECTIASMDYKTRLCPFSIFEWVINSPVRKTPITGLDAYHEADWDLRDCVDRKTYAGNEALGSDSARSSAPICGYSIDRCLL